MQDVCPLSETCSTVKYFELLRSHLLIIWVIGILSGEESKVFFFNNLPLMQYNIYRLYQQNILHFSKNTEFVTQSLATIWIESYNF